MSEPRNSVRPTRRSDFSNSQSHRPDKDGRANRHEPEIRWNRINIDSGALRDRIS
jgi:hypothetical protein